MLVTLPLLSALLGVSCAAAKVAGTASDKLKPAASDAPLVKLLTRKDGNRTRFFVENKEACEVTMTFELKLVNLKGEVAFPHTATFPGGQVTEAFTLAPVDPSAHWEFSYTNYYKLGAHEAKHDDSFAYLLPYQAGRKFKVTQAFGGSFSHKGSNKYAIDWKMPEGTLVCAARGGTVVKTKDSSDKGGSSMEYDHYNNFVLIRHEDGTLGHYCHLQKNGVLVKVGDVVTAGAPIAKSGNTGFSSGPHLHFCVFRTRNGRERESVPIKFRTAPGQMETLLAGRRYIAPAPAANLASGGAETSEPAAVAQ